MKMPNLTPNKQILIRKKLEPIAYEYDRDVAELLGTFVLKNNEFKGMVDFDTIIKIIEVECKENYKEPEPESVIEPIKGNTDTIKADVDVIFAEKVQMDLTGSQVKKINTETNRSVKMDSTFFDELEAFPPFLNVKNGLHFTLEIVDPSKRPRTHKSKNFGREEVLWDVFLLDIEPKSALTKEDEKGRLIYQIGKIYSLSMGANMSKKFKLFQIENNYEAVRFKYKRIGGSFQTDYIFTVV